MKFVKKNWNSVGDGQERKQRLGVGGSARLGHQLHRQRRQLYDADRHGDTWRRPRLGQADAPLHAAALRPARPTQSRL